MGAVGWEGTGRMMGEYRERGWKASSGIGGGGRGWRGKVVVVMVVEEKAGSAGR